MDPELFAAASAGVASLLAVLGLRRRSGGTSSAAGVSGAATAGTAVASAGAAASRNASSAVASLGHQALTVASAGVAAAGATLAKAVGLVVDGGVSVVEAVLPASRPPQPTLEVPVSSSAPTRATSSSRKRGATTAAVDDGDDGSDG